MMTLKCLRAHQKFVALQDPEHDHWTRNYVLDMTECLNEIDRLRNALILCHHCAKQGNVTVVGEIVTNTLSDQEQP